MFERSLGRIDQAGHLIVIQEAPDDEASVMLHGSPENTGFELRGCNGGRAPHDVGHRVAVPRRPRRSMRSSLVGGRGGLANLDEPDLELWIANPAVGVGQQVDSLDEMTVLDQSIGVDQLGSDRRGVAHRHGPTIILQWLE